MATIFPFMNWFSFAALSGLSLVSCTGFLALSMHCRTWTGTMVQMFWAIRMVDHFFVVVKPVSRMQQTVVATHARRATCLPSPSLSRSLVESLMTVAPRLWSAFARPCSSSSRSPCKPDGGGNTDDCSESGAWEMTARRVVAITKLRQLCT